MLIPLRARDGSIRAHAIIDEQDAHLAEHRWHLAGRPNSRYVVRNIPGERGKTVALHREIMGLAPGDRREVDHENGDRLDYRRANLRIVTHRQNAQNVRSRGGSSRHRGVSWDAARGRWQARAGRRHVGRFDDEQEAADAAAEHRREHMTHTNENRSIAA